MSERVHCERTFDADKHRTCPGCPCRHHAVEPHVWRLWARIPIGEDANGICAVHWCYLTEAEHPVDAAIGVVA